MRIIFFLFFLMCANFLTAQDTIKSKHYLFPDFSRGVVYYKEGAAVRHDMNYNLIMDEMQFINEKDKQAAFYDFDKVEYISIGLRRFIPLDVDYAEVVMDTDEVALVLKRYTKVSGSTRGKVNKLLNNGEQLADNVTLSSDSTYYLVRLIKPKGIRKGIFKGLALSQNRVVEALYGGFLKVYSNHKAQIEKFIKEEGINFNNAHDIIRLAEYCFKLD